MNGIFNNASFNQDISGWNVSNVTHMEGMFHDNIAFDQDLSGWTWDPEPATAVKVEHMLKGTAMLGKTAQYPPICSKSPNKYAASASCE